VQAAFARRKEPPVVVRAARIAFGAAVLQVLIAAAMIEMHFPPVFRSLHQAFGTLLWLSVVVLAIITHRAAHNESMRAEMRAAA
jgi:heme A synthase